MLYSTSLCSHCVTQFGLLELFVSAWVDVYGAVCLGLRLDHFTGIFTQRSGIPALYLARFILETPCFNLLTTCAVSRYWSPVLSFFFCNRTQLSLEITCAVRVRNPGIGLRDLGRKSRSVFRILGQVCFQSSWSQRNFALKREARVSRRRITIQVVLLTNQLNSQHMIMRIPNCRNYRNRYWFYAILSP